MAEVEYTTTADLPIDAIWEFVRDMDRWAPFVAGYQSHAVESDTDSLWTLKGDLGSLSRTLKFRVHVTEWTGPERVAFELKGLNEPLDGRGAFTLGAGAPVAARKSLWARFGEWLVRLFYRGARRQAQGGSARLHFRLELRPGGPMGPMVNAMIRPAMAVAAEDLANRIIGHLEQTHGRV